MGSSAPMRGGHRSGVRDRKAHAVLDESALMGVRDRVKVAAAQYPIDQPKSMQEWGDKAAGWVADGAGTGAEILVFPEYGAIEAAATFGAIVAADLERTLAAVAGAAAEMDALYAELARRHGVHIL